MSRLLEVVEVDGQNIHLEGGSHIAAYAEEIVIGEGTLLAPDLEIGMSNKWVERFVVGDNCRIYAGQVASKNFTCGDYVTIHEGVWAYGRNDIVIGHNSWFGRRCTLDAEGGVWIGNGLGAGQDTHMWSHIRHGDTLVGNRWLKFGEFRTGDDVWLTGRCTSAPVTHGDKSMAMVESNLTKGMPPNTVWGGNPAIDLTGKLGFPFVDRPLATKLIDFHERIDMFVASHPEINILELADIVQTFDLEKRTYRKTNSDLEVALMRHLLPEAKFVPEGAERVG